jgi:hypothetical protein
MPGLGQQFCLKRNLKGTWYLEATYIAASVSGFTQILEECEPGLIDDVPVPTPNAAANAAAPCAMTQHVLRSRTSGLSSDHLMIAYRRLWIRTKSAALVS